MVLIEDEEPAVFSEVTVLLLLTFVAVDPEILDEVVLEEVLGRGDEPGFVVVVLLELVDPIEIVKEVPVVTVVVLNNVDVLLERKLVVDVDFEVVLTPETFSEVDEVAERTVEVTGLDEADDSETERNVELDKDVRDEATVLELPSVEEAEALHPDIDSDVALLVREDVLGTADCEVSSEKDVAAAVVVVDVVLVAGESMYSSITLLPPQKVDVSAHS